MVTALLTDVGNIQLEVCNPEGQIGQGENFTSCDLPIY